MRALTATDFNPTSCFGKHWSDGSGAGFMFVKNLDETVDRESWHWENSQ